MEPTLSNLSSQDIYKEIRANIRVTDEISFKLLGLVPLISGAGLITVIIGTKDSNAPFGVIILLSIFAAAITLGLFRWELRNTQRCNRLLDYASQLEKKALESADQSRSFIEEPKAPQNIGKTEAEKFIYSITILAWIALPFYTNPIQFESWYFKVHLFLAGAIFFATIVSLFASTKTH